MTSQDRKMSHSPSPCEQTKMSLTVYVTSHGKMDAVMLKEDNTSDIKALFAIGV